MRSNCFCSRIKDPSCFSINNDPGRYGSGSKESACNAGDAGLIPGSGRSPRVEDGYPLQYSCLDNLMDRGAWWDTVYEVTRVGYNLVTKPPPPVPYT